MNSISLISQRECDVDCFGSMKLWLMYCLQRIVMQNYANQLTNFMEYIIWLLIDTRSEPGSTSAVYIFFSLSYLLWVLRYFLSKTATRHKLLLTAVINI